MPESAETDQNEPLLFLVDGEKQASIGTTRRRHRFTIDPILVRFLILFAIPCFLILVILPLTINFITRSGEDRPDFTCSRTQHNASQFFAFEDIGPESQFLLREHLIGKGLSGQVHVTGPAANQSMPILVEVRSTFDAADSLDHVEFNHVQGWQSSLEIELQSNNILLILGKGCLTIDIFIHVQPTVELTKFEVGTHTASVLIDEHASFSARQAYFTLLDNPAKRLVNHAGAQVIFDNTAIYLSQGSISGSWIQSKEITMHVSMAGNISIDLESHDFGDPFYHETQAAFVLTGHNMGYVDVRMPIDTPDVIDRRYWTSIWVESGDIRGSVVHSLDTKLETQAGSVDVMILPIDVDTEDGWESTIETHSRQGNTRLTVLDSLPTQNSTSRILSRTTSNHTVSDPLPGPGVLLWLMYPSSWSGYVNGHMGDGTASLKLDGLWNHGPPPESLTSGDSLHAWRGVGTSSLDFDVDEGNAHLQIAA